VSISSQRLHMHLRQHGTPGASGASGKSTEVQFRQYYLDRKIVASFEFRVNIIIGWIYKTVLCVFSLFPGCSWKQRTTRGERRIRSSCKLSDFPFLFCKNGLKMNSSSLFDKLSYIDSLYSCRVRSANVVKWVCLVRWALLDHRALVGTPSRARL